MSGNGLRRDLLEAWLHVTGRYPETGFQEINGYLPEADFWPGMIFRLRVD
jgi:hypothetical protein